MSANGRLPAIPLLIAIAGVFMAVLDGSIVNVAIPPIMNEFGAPADDVQWIVTVYMLAMGVVTPMSAWLCDRFGTRRVYIFAVLAFAFGSLLCGLAWSVGSLAVFRALQAVGGGLLQPVVMIMIVRMVPRDRIGASMGLFGLAIVLAPAFGPTLGGYLTEDYSWRWIFMINIPVGVLAALGAALALPDFRGSAAKRVDGVGALAAGLGLFGLLLALSEGQRWGWTSEAIVLLLYGSVSLLAFFAWWELRHPEPILDLRVMRHGTFTLSLVMSAVITVGLFAGLFYVPLFLQNVRGLSPITTGLVLMPAAIASGLMMPLAGALYDRIGPRPLLVAGLALVACATYLMHHLAVDTPVRTIAMWMMLRGFGMGLTLMPSVAAGMSVVPEAEVNAGSAMQNVVQRVAGSLGIAVLTSVLVAGQAAYYEANRALVTPGSAGLQDWLGRLPAVAGPAAAGLAAAGAGGAGAGAWQQVLAPVLYGLVLQRATASAMDDLFLIMMAVTLLGIVPTVLLKARYGKQAGSRLTVAGG